MGKADMEDSLKKLYRLRAGKIGHFGGWAVGISTVPMGCGRTHAAHAAATLLKASPATKWESC
jgi:hypothetical protein